MTDLLVPALLTMATALVGGFLLWKALFAENAMRERWAERRFAHRANRQMAVEASAWKRATRRIFSLLARRNT